MNEEFMNDSPINDELIINNLMQASQDGDVYEMRRILENENININTITNDMNDNILMIYLHSRIDPSIFVRRNDDIDMIRYLVFNTNININAQNIDGNTVLMIALETYDVENGSSEIIDILLSHTQINLDIQNNSGVTALMLAVETGIPNIVRLILNAQDYTDVNLTDRYGFTAMDYNYPFNNEIIDILIEAGGIPTERAKTFKNKEMIENTIMPHLNTIRLQNLDENPYENPYILSLISNNLLYPIDGKKKRKSIKRKSIKRKSIKSQLKEKSKLMFGR